MKTQVHVMSFADLRSVRTLAMLDSATARLAQAAVNLAETVRVQELAERRAYNTGAPTTAKRAA